MTVVAEVRFESALPADAIFGAIYPSFKADFPITARLPPADMPSVIRDSHPNFQFQPHYQLKSDKYMIQVGPKTFSFVRVGDYTGWADFGKTALATISNFFQLNIAKDITRTSIRYINFFEGADIFENLNKVALEFGPIKLRSVETMVRAFVEWEGFQHILLVSNKAENQKIDNNGIVTKAIGSIIDIDTVPLNYEGDIVKGYSDLLARMHLSEKSLFFHLLTPQFIETLHPEYK